MICSSPHRQALRVLALALIIGAAALGITVANAQVVGMAIGDEPISLDPVETVQLTAYQIDNFLMESLVYIGPDSLPHGWVAESWDISEDGLTIDFHIREGRKFHDGTVIDARAVAFSFNRHLDPDRMSANRTLLGPLVSVEAVSEDTVRFRFSEPYAPFWVSLASPFLGIVSPTAVEKYGADFGRNLVASGPFKLERWLPATGFDLVRVEGYTTPRIDVENQGEALLKGVNIRILPEPMTRMAALETGEIHFGDAPGEELDLFMDDPQYDVSVFEAANNLSMFEMNPFLAPTDDVHVRKAIAYAVNNAQICEVAYAGLASPNWNPIPLGNTGYRAGIGEEYGYRYDPEKARAQLEEAGYQRNAQGMYEKDGQLLTVKLWTYSLPNGTRAAQLAQHQMEEAGITVKLETFEVATLIARLHEREHNLNFMWWSGTDPIFLSLVFKTPGWQGVYSNPDLDVILNRAERELDPEVRQTYVDEAQKFLLEDAGVVPLCTNWSVNLTRAELKGLKFDAMGYTLLNDAYLE